MPLHRLLPIALSCLLLCCGSGCRLMRSSGPSSWFQPAAPTAFNSPPTVDEIVRVVNSNTAPVRQLTATSAYLTVKGYPPLRADIHLERPKRFRLEAKLIGPELDVGSNDELFWVWIKQSPQPAVLYARHDAFARSSMRQQVPIEPLWLTEALGIVELDPHANYEGPVARPSGELEIRTRVPSPQGELTRTYTIHPTYGWVLQQQILDARGQLLASAKASKHRYDPTNGVSLPQLVEVTVPPGQLAFSLSVGGYVVNQAVANPDMKWNPPQMEGYPLVDLLDPRNQVGPPPATTPTNYVTPMQPAGRPGASPAPPSSTGVGFGPGFGAAGAAGNAAGYSAPGATSTSDSSLVPDTTFSRPPAAGAAPTYTPQTPPGAQGPRYRGYSSPWK